MHVAKPNQCNSHLSQVYQQIPNCSYLCSSFLFVGGGEWATKCFSTGNEDWFFVPSMAPVNIDSETKGQYVSLNSFENIIMNNRLDFRLHPSYLK